MDLNTAHLFVTCIFFPSTSLVLLIISSFFFIVFNNQIFKENLYRYLKMEMLFLSLFLIFNSVRPIYICRNTLTREQYYSALIYLISIYMRIIFEMCSVVCAILSSFEFYLLISNKRTKGKKKQKTSKTSNANETA